MMTNDLKILKELCLPLLEEMSSHSSGLADDMLRGDVFWVGFNNALLGTPGELRHLLSGYEITDTEPYVEQLASLKAEYIVWLAQYYCAGHTNPAITLLLGKADAAFMEEVAFQKHMLAAITQAGRDAIRNELKLSDEFAGADISDGEIASAFSALHRDATRNELRKQLQQSDEEELAASKPAKKRRIGAIPFFFLRLAAAAAVSTVATIVVVKVYNSSNRQEVPVVKHNRDTDLNSRAGSFPTNDTTAKTDTLYPNNGAGTHEPDIAKVNVTHPYVILKGRAVDTASNQLVTEVTITMLDEKGKKQTVFSKDGKFLLRLPFHHDFVITGKKEGYHSARLSLSTMDARPADTGEVIKVVLHFSKDQ